MQSKEEVFIKRGGVVGGFVGIAFGAIFGFSGILPYALLGGIGGALDAVIGGIISKNTGTKDKID